MGSKINYDMYIETNQKGRARVEHIKRGKHANMTMALSFCITRRKHRTKVVHFDNIG